MEAISRITSRHNARLTGIRKVRDGKVADRVFIEGLRLAREALRAELQIVECVMTNGMLCNNNGAAIAGELAARKTLVFQVPDQIFDTVTDTVTSQGIILIANRPGTGQGVVSEAVKKNMPCTVLFLHRTNDPSNLGAVYRTAEAAGAGAIIVSRGSANVFSPKAIRASMGSNLRLPTWDDADFAGCVAWANQAGLTVRAADVSATTSHYEVDWKKPSMIVFGSEAHGLAQEELALADEIFKINMLNEVESLNLAVSAGVILFEARRQLNLK